MTLGHRRALEKELAHVAALREDLASRSLQLREVTRYLEQRIADNPPKGAPA